MKAIIWDCVKFNFALNNLPACEGQPKKKTNCSKVLLFLSGKTGEGEESISKTTSFQTPSAVVSKEVLEQVPQVSKGARIPQAIPDLHADAGSRTKVLNGAKNSVNAVPDLQLSTTPQQPARKTSGIFENLPKLFETKEAPRERTSFPVRETRNYAMATPLIAQNFRGKVFSIILFGQCCRSGFLHFSC